MRVGTNAPSVSEIWSAVTRALTGDVGITQAAADKVWASAVRALSADVSITQAAADKVWGTTVRQVTQEVMLEAVASDTLRSSADTEEYLDVTVYTLIKQMHICYNGTYRIKFSIRGQTSVYATKGKLYINGYARGTEREVVVTAYSEFSEDLTLHAGDSLSLYVLADSPGEHAYAKNLRVYCDYAYVTVPTYHPYVELA